MATATIIAVMLTALVAQCLYGASVSADNLPYPSVVYLRCTEDSIPGGSPYLSNLGTTLKQLADNTPYTESARFKTQNGGANCPAYGEASCDAGLSPESCAYCLGCLATDIWRICNNALEADVQYTGCRIHYSNYRF